MLVSINRRGFSLRLLSRSYPVCMPGATQATQILFRRFFCSLAVKTSFIRNEQKSLAYVAPSNPEHTSIYILREACKTLLTLSADQIASLCHAFAMNYIRLSEKKERPKDYQHGCQVVIEEVSKIWKGKKQETNVQEMFECVRVIFECLSAAEIGFLRGDLHNETFFELHELIKNIQKGRSTSKESLHLSKEEFKLLFRKITKGKEFRLPLNGIFNRKDECPFNLYQRQITIEMVSQNISLDKLQEILESLIKINKLQETKAVTSFILTWVMPISEQIIKQVQSTVKNIEKAPKYTPILHQIAAERLSVLALTQLMVELFSSLFRGEGLHSIEFVDFSGLPYLSLKHRLSEVLKTQIYYQFEENQFRKCQRLYDKMIKQKAKDQTQLLAYIYSKEFKEEQKKQRYFYVNPNERSYFLKNLSTKMLHNQKKPLQLENYVKIEAFDQLSEYLISLMISTVCCTFLNSKKAQKIFELAYENKYSQNSVTQVKRILINRQFLDQIIPNFQEENNLYVHLDCSVQTIIPPLPWIDPDIGGYYCQATNVMRYSNCPIQEKTLKLSDNHRLFTFLNKLANTPWKINSKVLDIVQFFWEKGGKIGKLPTRYSKSIMPFKSKLKTAKRRDIQSLQKEIQNLRNQHSLRCDFQIKLNIARAFSKIDRFYFPQNIDFRGRVYPVPPNFSHIGNDLARGLLLFADGRRLGSIGFKWLKIHTANLMDMGKSTIDQKLAFIEANANLIHKIAANPLKNTEWLAYEDCWQAIGSIIELSEAMSYPNPEDYVSYMHVHQDGSCNGLQHYAAIGRDEEGAYQVNLGNSEKPGDVYTHVANMIKTAMKKDIENPQNQYHFIAKSLQDHIKRKTVKQTVMTSVYGVTFVGAREQIYRQLKDQNSSSDEKILYRQSLYVAKLTLFAISNLFSGAHRIKKWFKQCASIITKADNPISWMTPVGIPVVQPYRYENANDNIHTVNLDLKVAKAIARLPVDRIKQVNAFPPNFIHSLDSSHMIYTCEACYEKGISFAAVHDSFWTHAADVETMNELLRSQFIRLHEEPLLQNLEKSFKMQYPQFSFPDLPTRGTFDLKDISKSKYFFS